MRFIVLENWEIRVPEIYRTRIWTPAVAKNISRRVWLNVLTDLYPYDGRVFDKDGRSFPIPEIDTVFTDADNRWGSNFDAIDETGTSPLHHCRAYKKLRLIALYNDIAAAGFPAAPRTLLTAPRRIGQTRETFPGRARG